MPIDPVCGMQIDEEEALTASYQGQTYYFCSEECRDEFREAPEEYVGEPSEYLMEDEP
ncbi:MAG: YHS domain-containing protein [Armatimonadota bacterium]